MLLKYLVLASGIRDERMHVYHGLLLRIYGITFKQLLRTCNQTDLSNLNTADICDL